MAARVYIIEHLDDDVLTIPYSLADEITLEDIVFLQSVRNYALDLEYYNIFAVHGDFVRTIGNNPRSNLDNLLLLMLHKHAEDIKDSNTVAHISVNNKIYHFRNYLKTAWDLLCKYNLEHFSLGDTIKKLGYEPPFEPNQHMIYSYIGYGGPKSARAETAARTA